MWTHGRGLPADCPLSVLKGAPEPVVKINNTLGTITLTTEYFANLVGSTATTSFGVSGMANSGPVEGFRSLLFGSDFPEKGVRVSERGGNLNIDIHIRVIYGMNISAIVESISQKVKYAVEEATGLRVDSINVYVDELESE